MYIILETFCVILNMLCVSCPKYIQKPSHRNISAMCLHITYLVSIVMHTLLFAGAI